jgi:hypothetical protein
MAAMKVLGAILIVSAIWLVLVSVREGRGHAASVVSGAGEAWMLEQHDPVVRLGRQVGIPAGHPLARLSLAAPDGKAEVA